MAAESRAKRLGNTEDNLEAYTQAREMMEKERFADISALLSPEEFAQYEMRNSNSAGAVMNFLQNIDVTEAEYTRLYLAQKAFNAAHPAPDPMKPALFAHWHLEMLARNEEARAVLGDTRFYAYMQEADRTYAGVAQALAKYPTVTSATTYQVYQLQLELQSQLTQITHGGPTPPDKIEEMKNTVAAYNTKLEAAVGLEAAEAFRNHYVGRIFSSSRIVSGTATPATK